MFSPLLNSSGVYVHYGDGGFSTNDIHYSHWNETITVGMDGSLLIREEMTFHLVAGSYGYAYRNLNWRSFHDLNSWSISSGSGTPQITYHKVTKTGTVIKFYWEWSRSYVPSGTEYTFILTYNVSSAMDLRGNRDRVYWNVIGDEFEYYIYDISTKVIFPKQYNLSDIRSTTYYKGKQPGDDTGVALNENGHTVVVFHQAIVEPYTAYTIDADSPPAGINMPFSWRVYFNQNKALDFGIAFLPLFLIFLGIFLFKGLDPRVKTIPTLNEIAIRKCPTCGYKDLRQVTFCSQCGTQMKVQSEIGPPDALTPVEVGVLLDEKFDNLDFVAEFFYLAERGYLRIIQIPDDDEIYFQLTGREDSYGELSYFSKKILSFVYTHSTDTLWTKKVVRVNDEERVERAEVSVLSLSTIKKHVSVLWGHKDKLYKKLSGGDTKYFEQNPEKAKSNFVTLVLVSGIGLGVFSYFLLQYLHLANFGLVLGGLVAVSIIGFIISKKMPKLTKLGVQAKTSWQHYLQLIRGQMLAFPDPYEQFNFSMDHFSYLLVDPKFDLPAHLKKLSSKVKEKPAPEGFSYITPYWYYYPYISYAPRGIHHSRPITSFDSLGRGFETLVEGISNLAESLPSAISNLSEGISNAIVNMANGFVSASSSGGSSGFGGGFGGGGGGGGGGGIG